MHFTPKMTTAVCTSLLATIIASTGCSDAKRTVPANHVAILIDGSGTFKRRRADAIERARALVEEIANTRGRRSQGSQDTVAIIAVDAVPAVLWRGSLDALREIDHTKWVSRFEARSDYASCTDVDAAMHLALRELGDSSLQIHKYMFVFSDLLHEPPATDDMTRCEASRKGPGAEFPWDQLEDVSVSVLWAPRTQKLVWQREIDKHELSPTFNLYTESESAEVEIQAPPPAKRVVTEREQAKARLELSKFVWGALKALGAVAFLFLLVPSLAIGRRLLRRHQATSPLARRSSR